MSVDWLVPPPDLKLLAGQLHVWCVDQNVPLVQLNAYWRLLAADEQARANRFRIERDRTHYVVARAGLRVIIGRYFDLSPEQVAFSYSEYDKPALTAVPPHSPFQFNVTHSGGLALLAFCRGEAVGIDVEKIRPLPDAEQIAHRFFSQHENQVFKNVPPAQRSAAFFNCWTRKEAYIKAIGEGLSCPLDVFDVTLTPGEPARLLRIRGSEQAAAAWFLHAFDPRPGFTAALAVTGQNWQLSFWQWPGLD